eukprot:SAG22_NODE_65_length_23128_cov_51.766609_6_plen_607_part_00
MDFLGLGGGESAAAGAAGGALAMATAALPSGSRTAALAELDGGDSVLVPMPDLFEKVRPLVCRADGSPRLVVRAAPYIAVWVIVGSPAVTFDLAWSHAGFGVVDVILSAGWWCVFSFMGFFPRLLHAALQPDVGPLAQLRGEVSAADGGASEDMKEQAAMDNPLAQSESDGSNTAEAAAADTNEAERAELETAGSEQLQLPAVQRVHPVQLRALRRWRLALAVVSVPPFLYGCMMFFFASTLLIPAALGIQTAGYEELKNGPPTTWMILMTERLHVAVLLFPFVGLMLMMAPAAFSWYFSMKVAVVLAQNSVARVAVQVTPDAVADGDTWTTVVARPVLKLATQTVPQLSQWGVGTALIAAASLLFSALHFVLMVHNIYAPPEAQVLNDRDREHGYNPLTNFIPCFGGAMAPIILSRQVAGVSTTCNVLLNAINSLRMSWPSSELALEVHNRTYPILYTLRSMNSGQGERGRGVGRDGGGGGGGAASVPLFPFLRGHRAEHAGWFLPAATGLGFTVLGRVVDSKTINLIGLSVVSFFFTAVSLLVGLGTSHWDHRLGKGAEGVDGDAACSALSAAQLAGLEAWYLMSNSTCSYNLTIRPSCIDLFL